MNQNKKKEACRNFQRGSCQYGERCRYAHDIQQQPKSNPYGFGTQTGSSFQQKDSQQQKPNPFGFGVNSSQPKASTQNQFKPFENKWTRNSSSSRPDNQPQAANHKCTDGPESCKRQINEDFENERPLWKLTCYGHCKNAPCDISGDISYEELRAASYDDAKRGLQLQLIVERERSLVNAKILEFENLRRNPRSVPPNATLATQSPFPSSPNAFVSAQNSAPPPVSSFGAIGASPNMGFGTTPSAPSNNKPFGQPNSFQMFNQSANAFGTNASPFGNPGLFNSQSPAPGPAQPLGNSFGFGNSAMSPQIPSSVTNQPTMLSNPFNGAEQTISNINSVDNKQKENVYVDASIWLKEKWNVGEIPEAAPPDAFCS